MLDGCLWVRWVRGRAWSVGLGGVAEEARQTVWCTVPGGVCGPIDAPPFSAHVSTDVTQMLTLGCSLRGSADR